MATVDLTTVRQEDRVNNQNRDLPYRFGIEHQVNLNLRNSGEWQDLPNGDRLWRLAIVSSKAQSINLVFDDFFLPKGGRLFVYNEGYEQVIGAFTSRNNKENRSFSTALVYGEKTYLEYYEPALVSDQSRIQINQVVHGYRTIFKSNADLGNSGACNVDTECPQGNNWRDELKSAGKTIGGGFLCSGTLVANTSGDRRPLFLTANHCDFFSTVVVYWRFERPNCGSGTPDDTQTTSGATLLASVDGTPGGTGIEGSDHLLLELLENPADNFDVYFCWVGCDRSCSSSCYRNSSSCWRCEENFHGKCANNQYSIP